MAGLKQISVSEVREPMYDSIEALRQLLSSGGQILGLSPRGYTARNGIDYCYVGIKSKDDTAYSIHAYGKEAIELREVAAKLRI